MAVTVEKKLCECGCGAEVKNRFVRWHHSRCMSAETKLKIAEKGRTRVCTDAMRERMAKAHSGQKLTEATKKKLSAALSGSKNPFYGKTHTDRTKAAISASNLGRTRSEDTRKKIGNAVKATFTEERRQNLSEKMKGSGNPFYGRSHSVEAADKVRAANTGKIPSEESRKKMSVSRTGKKNHFYGKTHSNESRQKLSDNHKGKQVGELNPMYGKPSSIYAGRGGISGRFNGLHFRSGCELVFLLDNQDVAWVSGETGTYRLQYIAENGRKRWYFPDFFCDGELIEIKPIGWQKYKAFRENVDQKKAAAEELCRQNGWTHRFIEVHSLGKRKIFDLRRDGVVELDPRWEEQYQIWLQKMVG